MSSTKGFPRLWVGGVAKKNDLSAPHDVSQNHLQWADLDILSDGECTEAYKSIDSGIRLNPYLHLCAGRQAGVDSCSGDSGGPLIVRAGNGRRSRSYLVGVVSGGPACAQGWTGYYARVSS
jgi:secreted trypsin-like serine protease